LRSLLRSLEDHGGLEELTDTSSFEGELLVEVSLHLLFRGLGFEANFSLDFVVDGHGESVCHFKGESFIHSFDKVLVLFLSKTFISFGAEKLKHLSKSLGKGVDHVDGSLAFDGEASPDGLDISIFVFLFGHVNELLVANGAPRRHGVEKLVDAHLGHGGLRKAHHLFNVSRADVYIKFTSNFGNHHGQCHGKELRAHSCLLWIFLTFLKHGDDGLVELVPQVDLHLLGHAFEDVVGDGLGTL